MVCKQWQRLCKNLTLADACVWIWRLKYLKKVYKWSQNSQAKLFFQKIYTKHLDMKFEHSVSSTPNAVQTRDIVVDLIKTPPVGFCSLMIRNWRRSSQQTRRRQTRLWFTLITIHLPSQQIQIKTISCGPTRSLLPKTFYPNGLIVVPVHLQVPQMEIRHLLLGKKEVHHCHLYQNLLLLQLRIREWP